jgi:hypothetical protein
LSRFSNLSTKSDSVRLDHFMAWLLTLVSQNPRPITVIK